MKWIYGYLFQVLWLAYLIYWQIAATGTKQNARIESVPRRIARTALLFAAIVLLCVPRLPAPWLYRHFMPSTIWSFWLGAAVCAAGLLFSVWARRHLGSNWSREVTVKQNHELITSGPYGWVRHPIYTGLLTGFIGTALAMTQLRGILAFVLVTISLWIKLRLEEQWMRTEFGDTYACYAQRVPALVPGLR